MHGFARLRADDLRRQRVAQLEMDLAAGDSFRIGQHLVTVLDVDEDQVTFRIVNLETGELQIQTSPPGKPK